MPGRGRPQAVMLPAYYWPIAYTLTAQRRAKEGRVWYCLSTYYRALAPQSAQARGCCDILALLAQYQNIATEVRRMQVADIAVRPGPRGGERHGHLGFGLNDLFNPKIFDLKAMGVIQLIDERELHFIPLLYHKAGWQPDLGAVEDHVNQGELLGFSRCCISGAKH